VTGVEAGCNFPVVTTADFRRVILLRELSLSFSVGFPESLLFFFGDTPKTGALIESPRETKEVGSEGSCFLDPDLRAVFSESFRPRLRCFFLSPPEALSSILKN
jgi:hypothetical protein